MVIVAIVMIIAALAAPGMMRGMAINRAQRSAGALARLGRRARADAITFRRAHVMVFRPGSAGTGRYELWRGLNDSCRGNAWSTIVTPAGCDAGDSDCADYFDTASYSSPSHTIRIATPVRATRLCFEPDGEMWVDTGSGNFVQTIQVAPGGARAPTVVLDRYEDGVGGGSTPVESRTVLFPWLQAARVQ